MFYARTESCRHEGANHDASATERCRVAGDGGQSDEVDVPLRCDVLAKVNTCLHAALEDASRNYARWLSLQGVDAAFPELWLPADSDALKALKLTIQTSAAVADHVVDLPFCAVQTNTNMTEKGAS